jgi:hypothetical protein
VIRVSAILALSICFLDFPLLAPIHFSFAPFHVSPTDHAVHGRVMDLVFSGQAGDGALTPLAFPACAFHLRSRQLAIPATLLKFMAPTEVRTVQ